MLAGSAAAAAAVAQTVGSAPSTNLNIPANPQFFGQNDPSVRKATALVNGDVITGTDVDQRVALVVLANEGNVPAEEMQRLRLQVLRNLVDESLQIQAAKAAEIKIESKDIENYYQRYVQNFKQTPQQFDAYLRSVGSSPASLKRQIHAEVAWARLQRRNIEDSVSVADEEVRAVIDRLNATKGADQYQIAEIFLSSTPETASETRANAARIVQQLRQGASFTAYARQFSEASTAAVGGDLGWVRAEQLPEPLAAVARALPVGQVSDPIPVPGGYSILAVQDTRKVLTADPRDAILSLKQLAVKFPAGTTPQQAQPKLQELTRISQSVGGCGNVEAAAARVGGEVVSTDQYPARNLPPALQDMVLKLSVGQATTPFGALEESVRILVLCGRDDPAVSGGPSFDQIFAQLKEERVNRRAQRYLRDLRRDAVVDYR
jgi:peptidyl-prolyl cis-trans isomerase SurA